jgi:hypothetical protein
MQLRKVLEPFEAKAREPVAVRQYQRCQLAAPHGIHERQEPLAREVETATDFLEELDVGKAARRREVLHQSALVARSGFCAALETRR